MKLFTKEIDKKLFAQYHLGNNLEEQYVVAKIFNPYGNGRWYLLNSDPNDADYLWAIVQMGNVVEVGSVSRHDLENARLSKFRLPLERDLSFKQEKADVVLKGLMKGKFFKHGGSIHKDDKVVYEEVEFEEYKHGGYMAKGGETMGVDAKGMVEKAKNKVGKWIFSITYADMIDDKKVWRSYPNYVSEYFNSRHEAQEALNKKLSKKYADGGYMAKGGEVGKMYFKKGDIVYVFQSASDKNGKLRKGIDNKYVVGNEKEHNLQKWAKVEVIEPISDEIGWERYRGKKLDGDYNLYDKKAKNGEMIAFMQSNSSKYNTKPISMGYSEEERFMAKGGKTHFKDKVKAIEKRLKGTKVKPKYQSKYGKKYNKEEAHEAASNIAGAIVKKYKMK
jgi:hypothetical protein